MRIESRDILTETRRGRILYYLPVPEIQGGADKIPDDTESGTQRHTTGHSCFQLHLI